MILKLEVKVMIVEVERGDGAYLPFAALPPDLWDKIVDMQLIDISMSGDVINYKEWLELHDWQNVSKRK